MRTILLLVTAWIVVGCGDDDRPARTVDAGPSDGTCSSDEDCDDGQECTVESCGVGGMCRYTTLDERCPEDAPFCEVGRGCVETPSCTSDTECDDGYECTLDSCGVAGDCRNMALNERCEGAGSVCDPVAAGADATTGCTEATGCSGDEDCDDEIDCTLDTCGVDETCSHMPLNERCTAPETCSPTAGCFESMDCTTDEECQDGDFCNGREFCMPEFGCQAAPELRMCDDSDDCTVDSCDTEADMCVFRCDSEREECGCPAAEVPCDGTFAISPVPSATCNDVLFGMLLVRWNVDEVTFSCAGPNVQATADIETEGRRQILAQMPRSTDGSFALQAVASGGCVETYRLDGMFMDADSFDATWTATFRGADCALTTCSDQTVAVTGTRIP